MKHLSLAAKYRPQTFAQVAGQDMVKAVLSRAAAEDRVAAAYLLSGTRGVGKTTIARIFAKALNCRHAPGPEPCNQCDQCRKITQGSHVDVTEIDGASNNSVEDARALRETIGYAPMEGRYKVFIIDEAHMLSRSAFNALLKTLEEPPARVVFIFATTEAHKFPITIVSRCQHFVFRHLAEDALVRHLSNVLDKEEVPFEEGAVRLIARRAAGSVRDSMSLLDQTLALGGRSLTGAVTREVLGLAGQELFADLFAALQGRDCAAVSLLCGRLFRQGVDIGFFVRELAGHLRDMFLLRQGGQAVLPSLGLPADESLFWQELASRFSAGHLHASWQMVLDAQRGIVQNPEPAAALELLLLDLALLPQLLPLDRMDPERMGNGRGPAAPAQGTPGRSAQPGPATALRAPVTDACAVPAARPREHDAAYGEAPDGGTEAASEPVPAPAAGTLPEGLPGTARSRLDRMDRMDRMESAGAAGGQVPTEHGAVRTAPATVPMPGTAASGTADAVPGAAGRDAHARGMTAAPSGERPATGKAPAATPAPGEGPLVGPSETGMVEADDIPASRPVAAAPAQAAQAAQPRAASPDPQMPPRTSPRTSPPASPRLPSRPQSREPDGDGTAAAPATGPAAPAAPGNTASASAQAPGGPASGFRPDWQAFCDFCARRLEDGQAAPQLHLLRQLRARWESDRLRLTPQAETLLHQAEKQRPQLEQALEAWGAGHLRVVFDTPRQARTEAELIEEYRNRPELQACLRLLDANIEHCTEANQGDPHA